MTKLLSQEEADAIRDSYYNRDKALEVNEKKGKIQLKGGKMYPQNEFFYKRKHPKRWKWIKFLKSIGLMQSYKFPTVKRRENGKYLTDKEYAKL